MSEPITMAPDYATARRRFIDAATAAGASLHHHPLPDRGPAGEDLVIDVAVLGAPDAPTAVLVVSGTHGVEGFAGSLCQSAWLEDHAVTLPPADVAMVFVHAINPYGFAWVRRVNEGNVDLNRNFVDFDDLPENEGYEEIAEALAPAAWSGPERESADAALLDLLTTKGLGPVQEAISAGQYRHPDGLFYGGTAPTRSHEVLHEIITDHLGGKERVAVLDLHTGLGPWAEVELITPEVPGTPAYDRAISWWGGQVASNTAGKSVSSPLSGEWLNRLDDWLDGVEVTQVALEWGTVDAVTVLQALRADNWLHVHGDPTGPDAPAIKAELRAAFAPDDPAWAAAVHQRFVEVLGNTLDALTTPQG